MKIKVNGIYDKNLDLIRRYREGDGEAGEELALLNRPLVFSIAARFTGRGVSQDELVEMGTLGLVKAINTFDFSRECAFSTYAVPLIFGEIRRFLRDDGMIKVSRESKRLSALLNAEREKRLGTGQDVGVASLAAAVGVSAQDAAAALFATAPPRSLDEAAFDGDDSLTLGSTVFDEEEEARVFDRLALRLAIEKLGEEEKKIIMLRYFKDLSQEQTARVMGMTQVKISRTEKKILAALRAQLI
ncbi:MAG: sigma-70 family RNA polymerase sigma factor [Clostridia bacterium]|nr:sigma-70 family RNA polymerase sigma factor [Clostridia bacterium]